MHHNWDNANQKQLSCKPNDQQNSNKLKIWRASLMLKQSEGFLSQKNTDVHHDIRRCKRKKQTRCGYSRRSKHFALAQNSKAAFINTQSTYLVKRKPSEITWSRTILFCFSRKVDCWVWVIGGHDSSPCSQQLTNQIWTRICIPTVFLFCHGMLTWLRQEFRPRIVKRNIYAALRARTIFFFTKKIPKKVYTNRWSWTCK